MKNWQVKSPKMKWKVETRNRNKKLRKDKTHASEKKNNENGVLGKVLSEVVGLLVLDEGHTPRKYMELTARVLGVGDNAGCGKHRPRTPIGGGHEPSQAVEKWITTVSF